MKRAAAESPNSQYPSTAENLAQVGRSDGCSPLQAVALGWSCRALALGHRPHGVLTRVKHGIVTYLEPKPICKVTSLCQRCSLAILDVVPTLRSDLFTMNCMTARTS